jgi:hypothetical protein
MVMLRTLELLYGTSIRMVRTTRTATFGMNVGVKLLNNSVVVQLQLKTLMLST